MCGYLGLALLRASPASGRRISPSPLNGEMSHVDAWLLSWAPFIRSVSISVSLHTLHPQNNQVFQSIYSFNFCAECVHVLTSRRRMGEAFSFNNEQATEELTNAQIIAHIMWNQHCPGLKKKKRSNHLFLFTDKLWMQADNAVASSLLFLAPVNSVCLSSLYGALASVLVLSAAVCQSVGTAIWAKMNFTVSVLLLEEAEPWSRGQGKNDENHVVWDISWCSYSD